MRESVRRAEARLSDVFRKQIAGGRLAREGAGSLVLRIASLVLGFLTTIVLARALDLEGFGVYSYVFALISILVIPTKFGLPSLVVREVASAQAVGDWGRLRGIIRWSNRVAGGFALCLTAVCGAIALLLYSRLDLVKFATFAWGLLLVPLIVLGDLRGAALRGLHRIVQGLLPEDVLRPGFLILFCGVSVLLAPGSLRPDHAMALHALASLLAFGIGALLFLNARPPEVRSAHPVHDQGWLRAAVPFALAGSMQVLIRQTDIVILGYFREATDVGIYRAVTQTGWLVSLGLTAMTQVVAPRFSSLYSRGELTRLQVLATQTSRITLLLSVPVAAIMIFAGGDILRLLFGEAFSSGGPSLRLLAVGQLVNSAFGSVVALLTMTGYEKRAAAAAMIAALVNVLLNLLLIPLFGMAGAAAATSITIMSWNVMLWREARKHVGIDSAPFLLSLRPRGRR